MCHLSFTFVVACSALNWTPWIAQTNGEQNPQIPMSVHPLVQIRLDAPSAKEPDTVGEYYLGMGIAFGPDGVLAATSRSTRSVSLWEIPTGKRVAELKHGDPTGESVTVSPDGKYLAAPCQTNRVMVWDYKTRKPLYMPLGTGFHVLRDVAFSPDSKRLASGAFDPPVGRKIGLNPAFRRMGAIEVWDRRDFLRFPFEVWKKRPAWVNGYTPIEQFHSRGELSDYLETVTAVAFSLDGLRLATGGEDERYGTSNTPIHIWRLPDGKLLRKIGPVKKVVFNLAFSPDGKLLASTSGDGAIYVWDASDAQLKVKLPGGGKPSTALVFSKDGRFLVSAGLDGVIRIWDLQSKSSAKITIRLGKAVLCLAVSNDGKRIAAGDKSNRLRIWNFAALLDTAMSK